MGVLRDLRSLEKEESAKRVWRFGKGWGFSTRKVGEKVSKRACGILGMKSHLKRMKFQLTFK